MSKKEQVGAEITKFMTIPATEKYMYIHFRNNSLRNSTDRIKLFIFV